ncbi:MAG: hypothetical protein AMXMBFR13_45730 [Phycisphaerae bacterium]
MKDGFGIVIRMVRLGNGATAKCQAQPLEELEPAPPPSQLERDAVRLGFSPDVNRFQREWHAQAPRKRLDETGVCLGVGPAELMIKMGNVKLDSPVAPHPKRGQQVQKSDRIRAAGYRHHDRLIRTQQWPVGKGLGKACFQGGSPVA